MTTFSVSNAAQIKLALKSASAGDTILLAGGDYGSLNINNIKFESQVTIRSDGTIAAFSNLTIGNSSGINFDNVSLKGVAGGFGEGTGARISDSENITIQNSTITGFNNGVQFVRSEGVTFAKNSMSNIGYDGIDLNQVKRVIIEYNDVVMNPNPANDNHRDVIQLMNEGADGPASDVTIRGNTLVAGDSVTHAIYMGNADFKSGNASEMYQNIVIEDNTIQTGQVLGICVGQTDGLVIRNNYVLQHPDLIGTRDINHVPSIRVADDSINVTVMGNTTYRDPGAALDNWQTTKVHGANWTISNNVIVPLNYVRPVDDAPTVTINQARDQTGITSDDIITFNVTFSEQVNGFSGSDVSFVGSTAGGSLSAHVSGSGANYLVLVSGMLSDGTVVASIGAGAAEDRNGSGNLASTSTDNRVSFVVPNHAATGQPAVSETSPTEGQMLRASTSDIFDADGIASGLVFRWQAFQNGVWTDIESAAKASLNLNQALVGDSIRVVTSFTDGHGNIESVVSDGTKVVGDLFRSDQGAQKFNGTGGADDAATGVGIDTLNGNDGNDILSGGRGNDIVRAGAGDDTIHYTVGDGGDVTQGGDGFDAFLISGTSAADVLAVHFNGGTITQVGGAGLIAGVESITADLLGGEDALTYTETIDSVTVDLSASSASGFNSVAGIENVTGGSGADTLVGSVAAANILVGGAGSDVLRGVGAGDVLIGGVGADTIVTGALNDDLSNFVRFAGADEFGDTVTNFDTNGTITDDRVQFSGALATAWDDGRSDGKFLFAVGNGIPGAVSAAVGQGNGDAEALLLTGIGGEGVSNAGLGNAALVAAAFNSHFNISASNGEDALLVINDTDANDFSIWQWIQAGGGELSPSELTLVGTFNGNASALPDNFDFL